MTLHHLTPNRRRPTPWFAYALYGAMLVVLVALSCAVVP